MDSKFDTTGVIIKISDDSCIVSVTINDVPRTFSFSKYLLFVFGLQCDGQMANILEEGMAVDLRYNLSEDNVPFIVAVWISEKPDHLLEGTVLKSFYNKSGSVIDVQGDNVLVNIDSSNEAALVCNEVFFRDGNRTNSSSALVIGDVVSLDAIPFESEHPTGAFYQATCAWVGSCPSLVDRFGLDIRTFDDAWEDGDPMEVIHGTVAVIPNEIVAFAEVEYAEHNSKVMLFRRSFASGKSCDIRDLINVGDRLCMRIRYKELYNGSKQVYAGEAWKDGSEVSVGNDDNMTRKAVDFENAAEEAEKNEAGAVIDQCIIDEENDSSSKQKRNRRGLRKRKPKDSCREADAVKAHGDSALTSMGPLVEQDESNTSFQVEIPKFDEQSHMLWDDPPLSGLISIISEDAAYILYNGLKIFVNRKVIFCDGNQCTNDRDYVMLVGPGNKEVFFEAMKYRSDNSRPGFTHMATCVWVGAKPSLTFLLHGNNPEPEVIIRRTQSFSKTKSGSATSQFDETSEALIGDPPLSGPISLISRRSAVIRYRGLQIYVSYKDMYIDGMPCTANNFLLAITTEYEQVNFEAVKIKEEGSNLPSEFSHKATCAWVGPKPSLTLRLSSLGTNPKKIKWTSEVSVHSKNIITGIDKTFSAKSALLYQEDPPLEGVLTRELNVAKHKAESSYSRFIMFRSLKVFFHDELYKGGKLCSSARYLDHLVSEMTSVNFEAVKTSDTRKLRNGFTHEATCVWIGTRPLLSVISRTLPPMRFDLLNEGDRTYTGIIRKFCLPKVAFVVDQEFHSTVSVHVQAFGPRRKLQVDYVSGKDCITSFVKINDIVEFKITRATFANVLTATNVKVLTSKMETFARENANVSHSWRERTSSAEKLSPSDLSAPQHRVPDRLPCMASREKFYLPAYPERLPNQDEISSSEEIKQKTPAKNASDLESLLTSLSARTDVRKEISSSAFKTHNEEIQGEVSAGKSFVFDSLWKKSNFCPEESVPKTPKVSDEEVKCEMSSGNVSLSHSLSESCVNVSRGTLAPVSKTPSEDVKIEASSGNVSMPHSQSERSVFCRQGTPPPVTKALSEEVKREASRNIPVFRESALVPRPLSDYFVHSSEEVPSKVFIAHTEGTKGESSRNSAPRETYAQSQKRPPKDPKCCVQ